MKNLYGQAHTEELINKIVINVIELALTEDGFLNDLSTQCCDLGEKKVQAKIVCKKDTVVSSSGVVQKILDKAIELSKNSSHPIQPFQVSVMAKDGQFLKESSVWMILEGRASDLLRLERTILNFLMRASGIATVTKKMVDRISNYQTKILHTRKTAPGLRALDIQAVLDGGGHAHRRSLDDAILIKENHIRSSSSFQALGEKIETLRSKSRFVEIEVTSFFELKHALELKPNRIMLDNFKPADVQKAVDLFSSAVELEASGNINLENIEDYAKTGVDYVSMGFLTHSAPAADLSMLFSYETR